jgi:transglutaminase-like putative cysteine protease
MVRVGCSLAYETTVPTPVLFVVKPRLEDKDSRDLRGPILTVGQLPSEVLRYTLPSRYCDSDKLMNFAWNHFGRITHGLPRVQAICDWVHNNIEYRFLSGRPDLSVR